MTYAVWQITLKIFFKKLEGDALRLLGLWEIFIFSFFFFYNEHIIFIIEIFKEALETSKDFYG